MTTNLPAETQHRGVVADMADRYKMDPRAFEAVIQRTAMPSNVTVSKEQFAAFLMVARQYDLDPLTKQIYAFPAKGGGIQPVVSIDGWMALINSHPKFDGMEFEDTREGKDVIAITCRMYRKDRKHPVVVTEYMSECRRGTDTWRQWPTRMLRHKAAIQAARYAFGFSGIVDEDEAQRAVLPSVEHPKRRAAEIIESAMEEPDGDPDTGEVLPEAQQGPEIVEGEIINPGEAF